MARISGFQIRVSQRLQLGDADNTAPCAHLISRTSPSRRQDRRLLREPSRQRCAPQGSLGLASRRETELANSKARTGTTDGAGRAPMALELPRRMVMSFRITGLPAERFAH